MDHEKDGSNMVEMMDIWRKIEFVNRSELFEKMTGDMETLWYNGYQKYTQLSSLSKLWNLKVSGGWSNANFT